MRKQLRTHNARTHVCSLMHGHPPESTQGSLMGLHRTYRSAISAQLAAGLAEPFVGGIPYTRAVKLLQMNPVITFHYKTFGHLLQYHQLFHTHQSSQFVVLRKGLAKNQFQNGAIVQCSPVGAELGSSSRSWPPRIDRRSWQA